MVDCNWSRRADTMDPAILYERKEARSCHGCQFVTTAWTIAWCDKKDEPAIKKCKHYKGAE